MHCFGWRVSHGVNKGIVFLWGRGVHRFVVVVVAGGSGGGGVCCSPF